jgi:pilus assembly protein CpaB
MRLRDVIGLILALVLAMGVALLTRVFFTREETGKKEVSIQEASSSKILVSGRELHAGELIRTGDLAWQAWPQNALNEGYLKEGMIKVESLTGAVVLQHLSKGEPVGASDFVKPGEKGILAAVISPGKRAISIDVTAPAVNSGLIFPGDFVDVILSKVINGASGIQSGRSKTIVQSVKVLAVDFDMENIHTIPKAVPHVATLEVSPSEAELITASAKEGTLALSLHSIASKDVVEKKAPVNSGSVIIMRGKERNEIQVQE